MIPAIARSVPVRPPAVAGSFYPAAPVALRDLVAELLRRAAGSTRPVDEPGPLGILVPHAGLVYSGTVAAAAWRRLATAAGDGPGSRRPTVVILGTNHSAWLEGVGAWEAGAWRTPLGDVEVDEAVAAEVVRLGRPFGVNRAAHRDEHSIEVQLPLLATVAPGARIVPLTVSAGTDEAAVAAGRRLGVLLADLRRGGADVHVAISTDIAHYPSHRDATRATELLVPAIIQLEPLEVAAREATISGWNVDGMACGMCGIQPTVLGLAALAAMGATGGTVLARATSADAGAPPDRTVGYLAVEFRATSGEAPTSA
jgi:MEMO1 family protein